MSAVPPTPQTPAEPAPAASRGGGRRSLAAALLLGALGSTVVLLASGQTWRSGVATVAGISSKTLEADGQAITGVPAALAIVGLAALVAVFAVRRAGRVLVSALLALSGAGAVAASLAGAGDHAALDEQAAKLSGDAAATVSGLTQTGWPYVTAFGGVLILAAGLIALRFGGRWPGMGGRYEREGGPRARAAARRPADPERPEELWKALDRGEDPTAESADSGGDAGKAPTREG
ncbi:TIGR02234 family membrane protein [Streptomyces sp. NBC_00237]|uniref:TIGR02234 family membrane protein n=1 Tax=Streptomyces sp. NBC_00237 TaxID=2975687 RepID=UPI0022550A47|nr:TIGR02234 family membrane protein [Streptomyces sp. NBC_00237]MCX5201825.1 TIGR02234 family membrane protein [Streptomyces sp. NBC_00237]